MIWLHCSTNKPHAVTKLWCVLYEGRSSNGDKLDLFIVLKYIIFVKIIKNFTYVIVSGFNWRHNGRCPLLWHVFSRQLCRCFWCFWKYFFYMCCRVINISLFLCYFYLCSQISIICRVNYGCSERMVFLGWRFIHNIWYHFLMDEWGVTSIAKKMALFFPWIVSQCSVHLDTL